jgi:hypothetical protein
MRTLLLILLYALCSAIRSQGIVQFDETTNRWSVIESSSANIQAFLESWTNIYGTQGDTIIGGETWARMFTLLDPEHGSDTLNNGYVRHVDDIVLWTENGVLVDTLYDFAMEPGDSALYLFDGTPAYLHLSQLDSITVAGIPHKQFHFAPFGGGFCSLPNERWIEGIGSLRGPLFPIKAREYCVEFNEAEVVSCFNRSDSLVWMNPDIAACEVSIQLSAGTLQSAPFHIGPNPTSGLLHVESIGIEQLEVLDLAGRVMLTLSTGIAYNTVLDIRNAQPGIYGIRCRIGDRWFTQRIVLE